MKLPESALSSARPLDITTLDEEELNAELKKGFADIEAGRTKDAKGVFDEIK